MAFDDIQLEQVEVLALDVCIEVGNSQTIILPTSSKVYIEIFDNDGKQFVLGMKSLQVHISMYYVYS